MYRWLLFLHIIGVFGFLFAHGTSAFAAFALRREANIDRVRGMLMLSASTYLMTYLSLLVLIAAGIIIGFMGHWWRTGWIWVSLVLLIAIAGMMTPFASKIMGTARKQAGLPYFEKGKNQPPIEPAADEEVLKTLAKLNPILLTVIGFGGIAVIAWLMMFKPF